MSNECVFCLDNIESNYRIVLTCGHVFHTRCMSIYLIEQYLDQNDCLCPVCRQKIQTRPNDQTTTRPPLKLDFFSCNQKNGVVYISLHGTPLMIDTSQNPYDTSIVFELAST